MVPHLEWTMYRPTRGWIFQFIIHQVILLFIPNLKYQKKVETITHFTLLPWSGLDLKFKRRIAKRKETFSTGIT